MNDSIEISADIFDVYPLTVEEYENADVIMDNVEVEQFLVLLECLCYNGFTIKL